MSPAQKKVAKSAGYGAVSAAIGTFGVGLLTEWGVIPHDVGPFTLALYSWIAVVILQNALSPQQWKQMLGMKDE